MVGGHLRVPQERRGEDLDEELAAELSAAPPRVRLRPARVPAQRSIRSGRSRSAPAASRLVGRRKSTAGAAHALSSISRGRPRNRPEDRCTQAFPSWKASTGSSSPRRPPPRAVVEPEGAVRRVASQGLIFPRPRSSSVRSSRLRSRLFVEGAACTSTSRAGERGLRVAGADAENGRTAGEATAAAAPRHAAARVVRDDLTIDCPRLRV